MHKELCACTNIHLYSFPLFFRIKRCSLLVSILRVILPNFFFFFHPGIIPIIDFPVAFQIKVVSCNNSLTSGHRPVSHEPFGKHLSPKIFTLRLITGANYSYEVEMKIVLCLVGGHYNMRYCIKGSQY